VEKVETVATTPRLLAKVASKTPEMLDVKNVGLVDTKDVEGFDTTEVLIGDTKEVEEVLDTKGKNNSKK
jgi:hypothetical protein